MEFNENFDVEIGMSITNNSNEDMKNVKIAPSASISYWETLYTGNDYTEELDVLKAGETAYIYVVIPRGELTLPIDMYDSIQEDKEYMDSIGWDSYKPVLINLIELRMIGVSCDIDFEIEEKIASYTVVFDETGSFKYMESNYSSK
jgi:hypothetical protein